MLRTEPLHDVKEYIYSVLTELPAYLEREESDHFQSIIECTFAGKRNSVAVIIVLQLSLWLNI